jgi:hypothetical protein
VIYPAALVAVTGIFAWQLGTKSTADITILRSGDAPFREEADGRIANQLRVRIANRSGAARQYTLEVLQVEDGTVIVPVNPFPVANRETATVSLFVILPRHSFRGGQHDATLRVADDAGFRAEYPYRLLGPASDAPPAGAPRP